VLRTLESLRKYLALAQMLQLQQIILGFSCLSLLISYSPYFQQDYMNHAHI
jgi:hypothetical protein